MARKPTPTEKRVVLPKVSWQQFETLLDELGKSRSVRMTYARNQLEMMTPLEEHDRCARLLESLLLVCAEEFRTPIGSLGSVLLVRQDLGVAIQPEGCYYEDDRLKGRAELNLESIDPPLLTIDVAIAQGKFDRLAIYDTIGVPEVWRYTTTVGDDALKGELQIYQRDQQGYFAAGNSRLFPMLPSGRVLEFLEQSDRIGFAQALTLLRDWIEKNR